MPRGDHGVFLAILDRSRSRGTARNLLFALARWANAQGECWPSLEKIAELLPGSVRAVQYAIAALIRQGELVVDVGASPVGTNVYRIQCVRSDFKPVKLVRNASPKVAPGGCKSAPKVAPEESNIPLQTSVPFPSVSQSTKSSQEETLSSVRSPTENREPPKERTNFQKFWGPVEGRIRREVVPEAFARYYQGCRIVDMTHDRVVLAIPTAFIRDRCRGKPELAAAAFTQKIQFAESDLLRGRPLVVVPLEDIET